MSFFKFSSMSKRTSNIVAEKLPNDLVIEILEWLPVRSVLRFKCVAKWWYNIIGSPIFIQNHRVKLGRRNGRMLLLRRCLLLPEPNDVLSFHDLDSPELEEVHPTLSISCLNSNVNKRNGSFGFLGSCNGIVCLLKNDRVALCNPALRQLKHLPRSPFDCPQGYNRAFSGLGFGITRSNEFKVILVKKYTKINSRRLLPSTPTHLYTLSTDSWKRIDDAPNVAFPSHPIFFNGACHWLAFTHGGGDNGKKLMLTFNMNTEAFRQLEIPDMICFSLLDHESTQTMVLNDRLAIIQHDRFGFHMISELVEIWVMEEYGNKDSWVCLAMISPQLVMRPFLSWKNDEWLLLETIHGQLASICFHTCEVKKFEIYGVQGSMRAVLYEQSLVSLHQGKALQGGGEFTG